MANIFKKPSSIKLPKHKNVWKNDQYGKEREGIVACTDCPNVKFKKRWYASLDVLKERERDDSLTISYEERCPACTMIKEHLYEGEITIEKFPEQHKEELIGLIRNFGDRATERDPQDRIIAIEEKGGGYRVTTTENQLAQRIAKKIKDVFNTVDVEISHSQEPYEVSRFTVTPTNEE